MQRNDPVLVFFITTWKKRERVVPLYWMSSWNVLFDEDKTFNSKYTRITCSKSTVKILKFV